MRLPTLVFEWPAPPLTVVRGDSLRCTVRVIHATEGQALQALGCSCAQGYGIARPMPASHVPGWLAQHRALSPNTPAAS